MITLRRGGMFFGLTGVRRWLVDGLNERIRATSGAVSE